MPVTGNQLPSPVFLRIFYDFQTGLHRRFWEAMNSFGLLDSHLPAKTGKSWEESGAAGNLRKRRADFMTDKAYITVDLVIFGVHPCFLRFFYDLPTIHNTSGGEIFPDSGCPVVYDQAQSRHGVTSPEPPSHLGLPHPNHHIRDHLPPSRSSNNGWAPTRFTITAGSNSATSFHCIAPGRRPTTYPDG
ncbi:hypothetical protein [Nocardia fluminea]|nr:hypothetical protein [Nocardia fluminea]